jgi:hypothetical protein
LSRYTAVTLTVEEEAVDVADADGDSVADAEIDAVAEGDSSAVPVVPPEDPPHPMTAAAAKSDRTGVRSPFLKTCFME